MGLPEGGQVTDGQRLVLRVGVDAGADGGATQVDLAEQPAGLGDALDVLTQGHGEALEFLPQRHRHRILQLGAPHLHHVGEFRALVLQRRLQIGNRLSQRFGGELQAQAGRGGAGVIGRL